MLPLVEAADCRLRLHVYRTVNIKLHADGSSGKAAATAAGAAPKSASKPEAKVKKPVVELNDLREQALRGRQPAAKQEETAAPAGDKHLFCPMMARPYAVMRLPSLQCHSAAAESLMCNAHCSGYRSSACFDGILCMYIHNVFWHQLHVVSHSVQSLRVFILGEKKEPTKADAKSRSKTVLEAGHLEKASKDTAAAEAPKPTKDAAPRASRLVAARSTNNAPKVTSLVTLVPIIM